MGDQEGNQQLPTMQHCVLVRHAVLQAAPGLSGKQCTAGIKGAFTLQATTHTVLPTPAAHTTPPMTSKLRHRRPISQASDACTYGGLLAEQHPFRPPSLRHPHPAHSARC